MSAIFARDGLTPVPNRAATDLADRSGRKPSDCLWRAMWQLLAIGPLCLALPMLAHAADIPGRCQDTQITVISADEAERAEVCAAVIEALPVLVRNGIAVNRPLTIELVAMLPRIVDEHAFAYFDARTDEITVLDYRATLAAAQSTRSAFGLGMSRSLWRSYVVHELAHAAAASHFAPDVSTFTASEYIAAVVQLSVLPESIRAELLADYHGLAGFGEKAEISATFYFIDPCAFAVKSYRHYLRPENGPGFIATLLQRGI